TTPINQRTKQRIVRMENNERAKKKVLCPVISKTLVFTQPNPKPAKPTLTPIQVSLTIIDLQVKVKTLTNEVNRLTQELAKERADKQRILTELARTQKLLNEVLAALGSSG